MRIRGLDAQTSGSTIRVIPIAASLDHDLLLSLIEQGEFGDEVTRGEEATDSTNGKWLETSGTISLESVTLQKLKAAIKSSVRININETDPELRIKSLFLDYRTFLRTKK